MTKNESTKTVTLTLVNEENEPISPLSNVLPKGSTQDQKDVHWFFNWAYGEMIPHPTFTIFDQEMMASHCSVGTYHERVEFTAAQVRAASRAREIDRAFARMPDEQVRVLQRWALPPTAFAEALRETFGRLAGVASRTPTARQLGNERALIDACASVLRHEKGQVAGLARHRARLAIEAIDAEAVTALADAFDAFAAERREVARDLQADEERVAMALFEGALSGREAS